VIPANLNGLEEKLDALLGTDPLRAERAKLRAYYLGDFDVDDYASVFIEAAQKVIDRSSMTNV